MDADLPILQFPLGLEMAKVCWYVLVLYIEQAAGAGQVRKSSKPIIFHIINPVMKRQ